MNRSFSIPAFTLLIGCLLTGCGKSQQPPPQASQATQQQLEVAETIYTGGEIVTVNDMQPSAQALAVKDGKILAVGARADVESAHKGANTVVIDLGGKALLPGFLDAHSHYISSLTIARRHHRA